MNLPNEHIFQAFDSDNCGPCCLQMVYAKKGKDIKLNIILSDFGFSEKGRATYPPQLAYHAMTTGLKTKLIIANPRVLSPAWSVLEKKEMISNLKKWLKLNPKHEWIRFGEHLLVYIQNDGSLEVNDYDAKDLEEMLKNGSILILCVDDAWLWGHRFIHKEQTIDELHCKTTGHYVVVDEYKNGEFHILDPFPTKIEGRHGEYWVNAKKLITSSLIWASTIVEILS